MTEIVLAYDRSPKTIADMDGEIKLLRELQPYIGMLKIGLEAMNAEVINTGGRSVGAIIRNNMREGLHKALKILWDQKIHDIGTTSAKAVRNIAMSNSSWCTIHASMSPQGLAETVRIRDQVFEETGKTLKLFGVTVLTDMDSESCLKTYGREPKDAVLYFANRLIEAGIEGIVCSGQELEVLREWELTKYLKTLIPGIRSDWAAANDQKRVMTPTEATLLGADYLVIGRQITSATDPLEAAKRTYEEIQTALQARS